MITILIDHDIEGYGVLLWGTLATTGWLDLVSMRLVRFADLGLAPNSTDRDVWHFAQEHEMYLLTNNRNMDDIDSLEQTLRDSNMQSSLPVITIGRIERMTESTYRELCALRLLEIVLYPTKSYGVGRLFIP
ncbi:MAG: hypothetical protein KAX40_07395 [Herpetosiphon sp.]|nr:hypothetical protein [Herpetosiphon sp.]